MARIPRNLGVKITPSGRTGGVAIPSTIIDTSAGIEAQGLGALGSGVTDLAQVLSLIDAKQKESEDSIAVERASFARSEQTRKYNEFVANNLGEPEKHSAEAKRLSKETEDFFGSIVFNDKTIAERQKILQKGSRRQFLVSAGVKAAKDIATKASTLTSARYVDSFSHQFPTFKLDGEGALKALKTEFGDELGELQFTELQRTAQEGRLDVLVQQGSFDAARELLPATTLDADQKIAMSNFIDRQEKSNLAANKLRNEEAIEAELKVIDDIFILPQDEFLASTDNAYRLIRESEILPVKGVNGAGKEGQRKKIDDRVNAIRAGKVDPITQFDADHYGRLSQRIANNSSEVSTTEIGISVGRGETGGLTGAQAEDLIRLKKLYDNADILGTDTHKIYLGALVGMRTAKAFSKNKSENSQLAARAMVALNRWAVRNPEATESDYQSFMDRLIDNSNLTGWQRLRIHGNLNEDRFAIQENLNEIEAELGIGRQVKMLHKDDGGVIMVAESDVEEALKEGHKRAK